MTIEEVINATTKNTAYAMGLENELGSIAKGKKANLFITKAIPTYAFIQYNFGQNVINSNTKWNITIKKYPSQK